MGDAVAMFPMTVLSGETSQPSQLRLAMTPIAIDEIEQDKLDITIKTRSNALPWKGQFSPQLIETLLEQYSKASDLVFDPFGGSGTVLGECCRFGLACESTELNPAAFLLSRIYELCSLSERQRGETLKAVDGTLQELRQRFVASNERDWPSVIAALLSLSETEAQKMILNVLVLLIEPASPTSAPKSPFLVWGRLRSMVASLPYTKKQIKAHLADARSTPLSSSTVDLVITSPPYINVFNYHQQYRPSVELLGWKPLSIARSEIGSNRQNRTNRFLTVAQYCLDMALIFKELSRVCKPDARLIFIVGRQSLVRGKQFFNSGMVAQLGIRSAHFDLDRRLERSFTNRFGAVIFEDILFFSRTPQNTLISDPIKEARAVAKQALYAAYETSEGLIRSDLESAIKRTDEILNSPIYRAPKE